MFQTNLFEMCPDFFLGSVECDASDENLANLFFLSDLFGVDFFALDWKREEEGERRALW